MSTTGTAQLEPRLRHVREIIRDEQFMRAPDPQGARQPAP